MRRLRLAFSLFLFFAISCAKAGDAPSAPPAPKPCQLLSASMSCVSAKEGNMAKCWAESPIFRAALEDSCPAAEKLQLVLNGQRLSQAAARPQPLTSSTVEFRVDRDHRDFLAIRPLVARERDHETAKVTVGVAVVDGAMLPTADNKPLPQVEIRLYDKAELWTVIVAALGLAIIFAGTRSGMLRDSGYDSAVATRQRTFSLARVQLFIWTTLILGGFLYIWLLTGLDNGVVTVELLSAYGIATATAAGGILQDKAARTTTTSGFLNDILSDANDTPSIHRLQMFAWTLVLAVIFIMEVWHNLRMPTFDSTLLSLMGFSGGAFVGLKTLEPK
jgi:hypothetical protein